MKPSSIVEEIISQAIQRGELDNLPGKGKPLEESTPNPFATPEETMLSRVLKSAGLLPIEVQILREMEEVKQRIEACKSDSDKQALKKRLHGLQQKYDIQMDARRAFFDR